MQNAYVAGLPAERHSPWAACCCIINERASSINMRVYADSPPSFSSVMFDDLQIEFLPACMSGSESGSVRLAL